MKVRLLDIAHARSGDKGDTANVGVIALEPRLVSGARRVRDARRACRALRGRDHRRRRAISSCPI